MNLVKRMSFQRYLTIIIAASVMLLLIALSPKVVLRTLCNTEPVQGTWTSSSNIPPTIASITETRTCPYPYTPSSFVSANEPVQITARITDNAGGISINSALLSFNVDNKTEGNLTMIYNSTSSLWSAIIPGQPGNNMVQYSITAWDNLGNFAISTRYSYSVKPLTPGDLNSNGTVNVQDLIITATHLGQHLNLVDNKTYQYDFIDIGDTHCGRGVGSDNLTANQRYSLIIKDTNNIVARFFMNEGDLTDGWSIRDARQKPKYDAYVSIRNNAVDQNHTMLQIRGNHDANMTMYQEIVGQIDWTYRSGDILAVGIGSQEIDANDWEHNGTTFNNATFSFLDRVIASSDYQQTTYHFLFQHFCTYSTVSGFSLPPQMANYYPKFDMILCGHQGGSQLEKTWTDGIHSVPMIKTAHLGDGKVVSDTFLTVSVNRTSNVATVLVHNFINNQVSTLWAGVIAREAAPTVVVTNTLTGNTTTIASLHNTFSINVELRNVPKDLAGYQFTLVWNASILNCTGYSITPPQEWGNNIFISHDQLNRTNPDGTQSYYTAVAAILFGVSVGPHHVVNTFNFTVIGTGETTLALGNVMLPIYVGPPISVTAVSGLFQTPVTPEYSSFIVLPLFMMATLLAVIAYKRKRIQNSQR